MKKIKWWDEEDNLIFKEFFLIVASIFVGYGFSKIIEIISLGNNKIWNYVISISLGFLIIVFIYGLGRKKRS